uniref:beta-N-acetylhexosaminidase n=1 Tax=Duncaniella freteri TaxID=2530391 RepID=UPI0025766ECD
MRKLFRLAGILTVTGALAACSGEKTTANYHTIPIPQEIKITSEGEFVLNSGTKIIYPDGNEKMRCNAMFLAEYLKKATGTDYDIATGTDGKGNILLQLGHTAENPEAYRLNVTQEGVTISGTSEASVFYGIQTLRKSIPVTHKSTPVLAAVEINDYPRFGYRGVHFDISRHFFTVEEAKSYIDMMTLHNMNRLHWHLTDDQGWRMEIKKYPLLTQIGSTRKETVIGRNSGEYDGKPYGGFYTQEDIKEVVAYAAERYITVIPEIDLPGHMQAALAAYPHLGCTGGPYEVWTQWGVSDNVLCAGNDSVLTFIDDILTEVMGLFPSKYIHIGGDECPKTRWEECPKCQARIKELGIKGNDRHSKEEYLQSYVINHAEKFLNDHGRQIIGWDEILEGGLAPNATVMSWRGEGGGIEAARQNHDVIMTPNTYLYFDYYQTKDIENEPLGIGGYIPLEQVYGYDPMPSILTPEQQKHIVGVQANHWSEYIPTFSHLQYMALPRWSALAEIQWSEPEKKNYEDFLSRLLQMMKLYDAEGYNYATHVFDGLKPKSRCMDLAESVKFV